MNKLVRLGAVITASALGFAACGKDEPTLSPDTSTKGAQQLAEARAANRTVYFLGDTYDGEKLMSLFDHDGTVTVTYGQCELSQDGEPSCAPPVQVHTNPGPPKDDVWTGCARRPVERGVESVEFAGRFFVFPGDMAVDVYTDHQRQPGPAFAHLQNITGSATAQANMPATSAATLALLDQKCGTSAHQ